MQTLTHSATLLTDGSRWRLATADYRRCESSRQEADPEYGRRVAEGLGLDAEEVERLAEMSEEARAEATAKQRAAKVDTNPPRVLYVGSGACSGEGISRQWPRPSSQTRWRSLRHSAAEIEVELVGFVE